MEQLNAKLHEKYNNLKKRKLFDEAWDKRDAEIANYQSSVEDLIEELKNENERLFGELTSLQEKYSGSEKLLLDETRKTRELSAEIGRLQDLLAKKNESNGIPQTEDVSKTPEQASVKTGLTSGVRSPKSQTGKKNKTSGTTQKKHPDSCTNLDDVQHKGSANDTQNSCPDEQNMAACCRRRNLDRSEFGRAKGSTICVFHTLFEVLIGVKVSVGMQEDEMCLSIIHENSGYTFSLTWVRDNVNDGSLMYHVLSLGTLERVALEWMKEDMVFSMAMCPIFFQRISRLIGPG